MNKTIFYPRCLVAFLLLLCGIPATVATGQESQAKHIIRLKSGEITAEPDARQWFLNAAQAPPSRDPVQVLIHFSSLPSNEQRTVLQQNGITLQDYIPDNTFTALITAPADVESVLSLPVYSIINTRPDWKADPYTWNNISARSGIVKVLVSFCAGVGPAAVRQYIASMGGQIEPGQMERYGAYKVNINAAKLRTLAQWYGVSYISPATDMVPFDLQSRPAVKGNVAVAPFSAGGYGLNGDSVTVGVGDNSSGIFHVDLKDRITNFNPVPMSHHGEHVNGLVGGASIIDPLAASMAPHVSLVDYLYDQILPATGAMYRDYNMTITNNSYGILLGDCSYAGTYDIYSHFLDTLSIQYPDVLHVFASGNDGGMDCSPYPHGFATVGGGFQPAKNDVVVGSITDLLFQAPDESRGPVKDGRLKPEIVGIGLGSYSTIDVDQYAWSAGTSMAAPQVAGGLAVLTQRYKQLNGGTQPHADMLKAILLNGGMDLGNPGPDYSYGFGAMDLYRSLEILNNGRYTSNTVANGDAQFMTIAVPANTAQLKVMLYWNDIPASPSSSKQLVNDLDLSVVTPSGATHLPLVLDPTPSRVDSVAVEKEDHLNNIEQVTIANPEAGSYTINTKGYSIPSRYQHYVVTYDIISKSTRLTYPLGGEQLSDVDSIRIFWDAISDGHTFTLQLSTDNGTKWTTLSNSIAADTRFLSFLPTGINSGNCLVRLTKNGTSEVLTSGRFAISPQPVARLDTSQCPGYVNIHWSPVPGASSYELLKKVGFYLQVVGTSTDTTYSFSGMSLTEKSYVAVQPIINGIPGYRSLAVSTVANTGNCVLPVSSGDIMIEQVLAPSSGRMFTNTQLGASSTMQLRLRNLYAANCNNYRVSWQINGGIWQSVSSPVVIPAHDTAVAAVPGLSLGALGTYRINIAVTNLDLPDPQKANDSASFTIVNLPNAPVDLASAFLDDFETMGKFSVQHDSLGVSPNAHWDFFNSNDTGRLRSFVNDDITISGKRSISLDDDRNVHTGSRNTFVGTFNLAGYDTSATEIRLDFDYLLSSIPTTSVGNLVTARGNDNAAWTKLFAYDLSAYPGSVASVRSLSLTDAVRAGNANFSSSTQLSFGQNDTSLIAAAAFGNGLTLDNVKLYTVTNDAVMAGIVSPQPANCGLPASVPLTIQVHNGVSNTLHNVQVFYSFDGGHTDSILNYHIRNSQVITAFPYLEDFESGDGGYYGDGLNSSWQYGTPSSARISKAASGAKAWKTNLSGNYNNLEKSYLYSPCFDLSHLVQPMLSFSTAMNIENCGSSLCDAAWVEYSFDGGNWKKLGTRGQGTNWYDSTFDVWNTQGKTRWHVVSIPVPLLGAAQSTHFRFVMSADPGSNFDGFAVDDVHIYDLVHPIAAATGITSVVKDISGNEWASYLSDSQQLVAALNPASQLIDNAAVTLYKHDTVGDPTASQFTFARSYSVTAPHSPGKDIGARLYLTDSEIVQVMKDTTCPSCARVTDAYSLGITQFANSGDAALLPLVNGTLIDNSALATSYIPYKSVKWVPYDKGYYAEFSARPSAEYWFSNGGPTGNFPIGSSYLNFLAFRSGANISTYWYSLIDTVVKTYTVQRSRDGREFTDIADTPSRHMNPGQYTYIDSVNFTPDSTLYYRLRWTMQGTGNFYYSPVRKISGNDSGASLITLDAHMNSHNNVQVTYTSFIDPAVHYYRLERAIGGWAFLNVNNTSAVHSYGRQYLVNDNLGEGLRTGTQIHYRLTAILDDGTEIVLPIHTLDWRDNNSVINLYPNPTTDGSITISWNADAGTLMQVNITDALGRSIYQSAATATQWANTTTLQTFRAPRGIYFARIDIGGKRYSAKVVYE